VDVHIAKYGELYAGEPKSRWVACGRCGFVHQNPRPTVDDLNAFYSRGEYHTEIPSSWRDPALYARFAESYYGPKVDHAIRASGLSTGSVFEVGAGHGGSLQVFRKRGWRVVGVEPDPTLQAFAVEVAGVETVRRGLLDRETRVAEQVDLVYSNHTFEHVADLASLMAGIRTILKPGGIVFTAVPTYYRNRSRMSLLWMNSAHYSLFTHASLDQLLARHDLEEVAHTYRGWRQEVDDLWHVSRFTGRAPAPETFYEDARAVARYVNLLNPVNTAVHAPFLLARRLARRVGGALKRRTLALVRGS